MLDTDAEGAKGDTALISQAKGQNIHHNAQNGWGVSFCCESFRLSLFCLS